MDKVMQPKRYPGFFFRLQAVGGPVYLSQIGYVGAAVGLLAGVTFLGERYALLTWTGAAVIASGADHDDEG